MPATNSEETDYRTRGAILLLLPLFFGLLLCAIAFFETWVSLHQRWTAWTEAYAHGYIAVAASFYLLGKALLGVENHRPAPVFVILLLVFAFLWFLGARTSTQILAQASLPLIIWSMVAAIYGYRAAVGAILPIALLYFAIPLWEVFNTSLRILAVNFSERILMLFGVPALIDGFRVSLSYGVIEVAGSCSGLNYLVTGLFTGTLYAGVYVSGIRRKALCIVLAVVMALLVNWVRIASLILIAHYTRMESSLVYSHHTYGWVLFAVALFIYFFVLERVFSDSRSNDSIEAYSVRKSHPALSASNYISSLACVTVVCFFPFLYGELKQQQLARSVSIDPEIYTSWQRGIDEWLPHYHGWDEEIRLEFKAYPESINMLALVYLNEEQGRELSYFNNRIAEDVDDVEVLGTIRMNENSYLRYRTVFYLGNYYLVSWLYKVENQHTHSSVKLKLLQFVEGGLKMRPYSSALMSFKVRCEDEECSRARSIMGRHSDELRRAVNAIQFIGG